MAPRRLGLSPSLGAGLAVILAVLTVFTIRVVEARQAGMAEDMAGHRMASVTGCVQKDVEPDGCCLTGTDGKV